MSAALSEIRNTVGDDGSAQSKRGGSHARTSCVAHLLHMLPLWLSAGRYRTLPQLKRWQKDNAQQVIEQARSPTAWVSPNTQVHTELSFSNVVPTLSMHPNRLGYGRCMAGMGAIDCCRVSITALLHHAVSSWKRRN